MLAGSFGAPATGLADMSRAASALSKALTQVYRDEWRAAAVAATPGGAIVRDIVEWHRLREGGQADFGTYQDFFARRGDWPGLDLMRTRAEGSILDTSLPRDVLAWFGGDLPRTGGGVIRLLEAHASLGETGEEHALAVIAWRSMRLTPAVERVLLTRYPDVLADHHVARFDFLLWEQRWDSARRMFPRIPEDWQALALAREALATDASGVDTLIEAVPAELNDHPGLTYERFMWRVRKGRREEAKSLILQASMEAEQLGEPIKWANWRRIFARELMREGQHEAAYRLASRHFLLEGSSFADLEWLSGYLALRFLNDPDLALLHFERFEAAVQTPISLGRAGYWRGRALEALGEAADAQTAYEAGARWQTSFYGLLAAEAAGVPMDDRLTGREVFPQIPETSLASDSVLAAALLLREAGYGWLAERFLTHLVERLPRPEAGALAKLVLDLGEDHIALMVAKRAARSGVVLPAAYFPLSRAVTARSDLPVDFDLALAIARRESEFDPVVVSPAGARGLMQLMPGTAQDVSRKLGLRYSRDGLTSDPSYNVTLGSAYLAELIESFGAPPILVCVGYNAGPGRSIDWVRRYGDPRSAGVDLVDWIEGIPFRETRNYVMRVTESVFNYRARLTGETGPVEFLDYLRKG